MPVGFQVGPLFIRFYGIILMLGAVAAAFVAEREVRRRGMNADLVWDALIWLLVGGIVGARLWHVFTPPPSMVERGITVQFYLTHPLDILTTWNGGLGLPGAVIGGLLALYLFCRRKKLNFLVWVDIAAPALALGQAIGRWGNYVNQELYGAPTSLPWRIFIAPANRLPGYENVAYYHPLFLYESLWNFANFLLLMWLSRKQSEKLLPGDIFLVYLDRLSVRALHAGIFTPRPVHGGRHQHQPDDHAGGGGACCRDAHLAPRPAPPDRQSKRCLTHIIDSRTAFSLAGCPGLVIVSIRAISSEPYW